MKEMPKIRSTKFLPSPKRLPAAQGFGRRGFAQAGEFRNKFLFDIRIYVFEMA